MSICQCVIASVCGHTCVFECVHVARWKRQKEVKMKRVVCVGGVCFCRYVGVWLVVRRSQPLMTFACCRCEWSDPAVLIKTNGTDRSPLIVFH